MCEYIRFISPIKKGLDSVGGYACKYKLKIRIGLDSFMRQLTVLR